MIQLILTTLSIFGAWAVTEPEYARWGFAAWAVSNTGWIYTFRMKKDYWPCFLFFVYWFLAIKGVLGI